MDEQDALGAFTATQAGVCWHELMASASFSNSRLLETCLPSPLASISVLYDSALYAHNYHWLVDCH